MVEVLLERNAEVDVKHYGYAALTIAAQRGRSGMTGLWLDAGAGTNVKDKEGRDPLAIGVLLRAP